jgi:hypothetical protein
MYTITATIEAIARPALTETPMINPGLTMRGRGGKVPKGRKT